MVDHHQVNQVGIFRDDDRSFQPACCLKKFQVGQALQGQFTHMNGNDLVTASNPSRQFRVKIRIKPECHAGTETSRG